MIVISRSVREQFLEIADDNVCSLLYQFIGAPGSVDPDNQSEAASPSRLYACNGILNNNRAFGFDPELSGSDQEHLGIGLPRQRQLCSCLTVNTDIEERLDSGCLENRR